MSDKNNNNDDLAKKIFEKIKILPKNGILVATIQINRTGRSYTAIYNTDNNVFMENYPFAMSDDHSKKEIRIGMEKHYVTYFHLPSLGIEKLLEASSISAGEAFCCKNIKPYKERRTNFGAEFKRFTEKSGTVEDYIFEVLLNTSMRINFLYSKNLGGKKENFFTNHLNAFWELLMLI